MGSAGSAVEVIFFLEMVAPPPALYTCIAEVPAAEEEAASESAPVSEPATSVRGVGRETNGILLVGGVVLYIECYFNRLETHFLHENFKQKFVISFTRKTIFDVISLRVK